MARALERAHGADVDAAGAPLAAHYEAAGATDEAVDWHVRAAEAAQRRHDHRGRRPGARACARALRRSSPPTREREARELAILTALPAPLIALDGYRSERLVEVHDRALGLARSVGAPPEPPLVRSLALAALTNGDFDAATAFGEQLRAGAERAGDDVLWIESAWVLAVAAFWQGRLEPARAHFEGALARWRPEQRAVHLLRYGQDPELACLIRLAHTLWLLGHDGEAARTRDAALERAAAAQHAYSRGLVDLFAAVMALDQRDDERLRGHVEALAGTAGGPARALRRGPRGLSSTCSTVASRKGSTASAASWTAASAGSRPLPASRACSSASWSRRARGRATRGRAWRRPSAWPGRATARSRGPPRSAACAPPSSTPSVPRPPRSRPSCGAPSRPRRTQGAAAFAARARRSEERLGNGRPSTMRPHAHDVSRTRSAN